MKCPKCKSKLHGDRMVGNNTLISMGSCLNPECKVGPAYSIDQTDDPLDTIKAMKQLAGHMLSEASQLEKMWTKLKSALKAWPATVRRWRVSKGFWELGLWEPYRNGETMLERLENGEEIVREGTPEDAFRQHLQLVSECMQAVERGEVAEIDIEREQEVGGKIHATTRITIRREPFSAD